MRKRLLLLLAALGLTLGACTPQEAMYLTFGRGGGGSDALYSQADRVSWCESRHNPNAVSPTNDHGLFQINIVHRSQFERVTGEPWSKRYDALTNARYARHLYNQQGWGPWACRHAA